MTDLRVMRSSGIDNAGTSVVAVGDVLVGGTEIVVMAGPCAAESEAQVEATAVAVKRAGATVLRGGAFKPRTSPYSFQGLGEAGLRMLRTAADCNDLKLVSEVMEISQLDVVLEYADILRIGARNMQNFALLRAAAGTGAPVLLIEVHVTPDLARSDGEQSLAPAQFCELMDGLRALAPAAGRALRDPAESWAASGVPDPVCNHVHLS